MSLLKISKVFNQIPRRLKHTSFEDGYRRALAAIPPTELSMLNNNVRVASQTLNDADVTTVGIFIQAGSRFEEASTNGAANLIERLIFKGTSKRPAADLQATVQKTGMTLRSFTSREITAVYGNCLNEHVPILVDILADAVQNANYSDADLESVRKTVLREHDDIEPNLQQITRDYLHGTAFMGTPLAQSSFGPRQNIESLQSKDLKYYKETHFKASRIVVAAAGGVSHSELAKLSEQHLNKLDDNFDGSPIIPTKCRYTGSDFRLRDDSVPFAHVALAVEAPGYESPDHLPLEIARAALNKYDISSGRYEGSGADFCRSFEAFNDAYSGTGLFGVQGVCDGLQLNDFAETVIYNWHRLGRQITDAELQTAKNRLTYEILKKNDGATGNCLEIGKSIVSTGRRVNPADLVEQIERFSNETIREVAEKYTHNKCLVIAAAGPTEALHEYIFYRGQMWKLF